MVYSGTTALMHAASNLNVELVKLLVLYEKSMTNSNGDTALMIACKVEITNE